MSGLPPPLGLYLHIPFCQAICSYCNFNRGLLDPPLKARYVRALIEEIRRVGDGRTVDTIFFGGGTPSLLAADEVAAVLDACRQAFSILPEAEVTLETNPETASEEKLRGFKHAGVNRLSFGVQSFHDAELQRLGRIHSSARAAEAIQMGRGAGIQNVSLDLMLWLPGQTPRTWRSTVAKAIELRPEHVSLYLLELYPNAPLKEAMARASGAAVPGPGDPAATSLPDWQQTADDAAADMYLEGLEQLDAGGYEQYEISNVAKPGRASRHNLKYWQAADWVGFGCGAHSTDGGRRWSNIASTVDYIERTERGESATLGRIQNLSPGERRSEALFTGLRLAAGIDRGAFEARFEIDPWEEYGPVLAPYVEDGFMWLTATHFGLTRRGMLVANEILVTFV